MGVVVSWWLNVVKKVGGVSENLLLVGRFCVVRKVF